MLQASLDAVIGMDHNGDIAEFNPAAERIFGYAKDAAIGRQLADLIIPERLREQHRAGFARYLATGVGPVVNKRIELPALRADGSEFPAELAIVPVRGDPVFFIGFLRDISARKQAEQRQQFLLNELAHRCRNLLTVVHSLVSRSMAQKRPVAEMRDRLLRRIEALSHSQSVLVEGGMVGAPLADIVRTAVEAFSERVDASGPNVMLSPQAAQTFALIVHELATNALKHGALSVPGGSVSINWTTNGSADDMRFSFRWREQNGPPVRAPTRTGFGRSVIEAMAAREFGVAPAITFDRQGLTYEIDAPLNSVSMAAEAAGWAAT